jgi:tripeptide aminopeptidase
MKDSKFALDLVMRLMAVPGVSCQEGAIAEAVVQELSLMGVAAKHVSFDTAHKRTPLRGQIGNLIVKLPGKRGLPRIMLSAHLDTVPICQGCQPKKKGGLVVSADPKTGLGADDRAGVAAVLFALRSHLNNPLAPPITACFFVQEEIGLQGSRALSVDKLGQPDFALNFDGGNPFKLTLGATGGERMSIRLIGIPAHAGIAPQQGASAIHAAGLAIGSLVKDKWLGAVQRGKQTGTSNIGVIHGGSATNVVADLVEVSAEARSHHSPLRTAIADAIEQAFRRAAAQVVTDKGQAVNAEIQRRVDYESFRLSEDSAIVAMTKRAISELGQTPEVGVTNGGIDANWLVKHGIPTVTIGCGQRNVHTNCEQLDISDYLASCEIANKVISYVAG